MNNTRILEEITKINNEGDLLGNLKVHLINKVIAKTDLDITPDIESRAYTDNELDLEEFGKLLAFCISAKKLEARIFSDPNEVFEEGTEIIKDSIELVQNTMREQNDELLAFATALVTCLGHKVQQVEIRIPKTGDSNG